MRAVLLKVGLAAAALAAVPSAALAATGWKSTTFVSGQGFSGKSVITHCGSKLGVYTLRGTVHINGYGQFTEVVTVPLKGDHKAHAEHLVRMGGPAYAKITPAEREQAFRKVAAVLDHVKFTVVAVHGATLTVKEAHKGSATVGTITLKKYAC